MVLYNKSHLRKNFQEEILMKKIVALMLAVIMLACAVAGCAYVNN